MMSKDPFIVTLEILPSQVQAPYYHVHHADIIKLLEQARLELLKAIGQPLESFLERDLFWVIAGLEIKYLREVRVGTIQITCEQAIWQNKRLNIPQKIFNQQGKLLVQSNISLALYSNQSKRAIDLPQEVLMAFGL